MARKKKETELERQEDLIKEALEDLALVTCPAEQYVQALERIQFHIEASIQAAKDDIRRTNRG